MSIGRSTEHARRFHALSAAVAGAALLLQLVLVVRGDSVLAENVRPDLLTRLGRLCCYFTIQSNVLVLFSSLALVRDPHLEEVRWRAVRLAAITGITITGAVHFVALRPLLSLEGLNRVADTLLHVVVPLLVVLGWLVLGPRPRASTATAAAVLVWPLLWLLATLSIGAATGWYPYPFLDPAENGWAGVGLTALTIAGAFLAVLAATVVLDRRLSARPASQLPVRG